MLLAMDSMEVGRQAQCLARPKTSTVGSHFLEPHPPCPSTLQSAAMSIPGIYITSLGMAIRAITQSDLIQQDDRECHDHW